MALEVADRLEELGIDVILTRNDDTFIGLQERCDIATKRMQIFLFHFTETVPLTEAVLRYGCPIRNLPRTLFLRRT